MRVKIAIENSCLKTASLSRKIISDLDIFFSIWLLNERYSSNITLNYLLLLTIDC